MSEPLKAPFPWFGGKSRVAAEVWQAFGDVRNYVEPFAGSLAVLLGRPRPFEGSECVNDKDGFIANFWRATQAAPEEVARWADNPVNENDLHARHGWLLARKPSLAPTLEGDPDYFDAKIAGWWAWGICCWIGSGWCSGSGPWHQVTLQDGTRQLVHLGNAGRGVNRKLVHLGNAGRGVNRQRVVALREMFLDLGERLARVRVCCGDWGRVCTATPTVKLGLTGLFFDPPYSVEDRADLYNEESYSVAREVFDYCRENGDNPKLRIALCGYDGEHNALEKRGWKRFTWKTAGGYASQASRVNVNARRERIWFSPHCLPVKARKPRRAAA